MRNPFKTDILVSSEAIEKSHADRLDFKPPSVGKGGHKKWPNKRSPSGRTVRRLTPLGPEELEEFRLELLDIRQRMLVGKGQAAGQDRTENATRAMALLHEIDDALDRIETKTYGICQATQKLISKSQLKGMPWARYAYDD